MLLAVQKFESFKFIALTWVWDVGAGVLVADESCRLKLATSSSTGSDIPLPQKRDFAVSCPIAGPVSFRQRC